VIDKSNGDVTIGTDLAKLNEAVRREVCHISKVKETLNGIDQEKVFSYAPEDRSVISGSPRSDVLPCSD
jgi:hypothetical protein